MEQKLIRLEMRRTNFGGIGIKGLVPATDSSD